MDAAQNIIDEDKAAVTCLLIDLTASMERAFDRARQEGRGGFARLQNINHELFGKMLWQLHQRNYVAAINYLAMIWYRDQNNIEPKITAFNPEVIESIYLRDVGKEYDRANKLFLGNAHNMNALTEEVGELAQALLQLQYEPHKGKTNQDVVKEAIQVCAVAMKIALHGDTTFPAFTGLLHEKAGV